MIPTLETHERTQHGTSRARALRGKGEIPGVVYGRGEESKSLIFATKSFARLLESIRGRSPVIELKIGDEPSFKCIIKSIQKHPVTGQFLHVDFQKIHPKEKLVVSVPISLAGTAPGIKQGGILDHHLRDVSLRGVIDAIPTHIEVNVSDLKIGQTIHLRDLKLVDVEPLVPVDTPVVSVLVPKRVEEVAPAAEAAPVEPELIRPEKKEGEEAEEEAAEKGKEKPTEKGKEKPAEKSKEKEAKEKEKKA